MRECWYSCNSLAITQFIPSNPTAKTNDTIYVPLVQAVGFSSIFVNDVTTPPPILKPRRTGNRSHMLNRDNSTS
jgi:hypothetical protein